MSTRRARLWRLLVPLLVLALLLTACNQGMPAQSGEYQIKPQSLSWDGQEYRFAWLDRDGSLRWASGTDVQLVQDDRTYLEMRDGRPIVHLTADEPVAVLGRDRDGDFSSSWFPFLAGAALGNAMGNRGPVVINEPYPGTRQVPPRQPAYRYPPTDSFGRGDTLGGSVTNSRPSSPDYNRIRPIADAVSGQSGGAGGGSAASSKAPSYTSGQSGGAGTGTAASAKGSGAVSGQTGGTGAGSAASSKGTFRSGTSGTSSSAPKLAPSGSGSAPKLSPGTKAPSTGASGARSSGGFGGAKSIGGFKGGKR